jgi:hypothetical protein
MAGVGVLGRGVEERTAAVARRADVAADGADHADQLASWGLFGFGLVPSLQYRVVSLAGPGADVAAALPASAINAGIALGSLLGGWALIAHGPAAPAGAAIVLTAAALVGAVATSRRHPASPGASTTPPRDAPPDPVTVPVRPLPDDQPCRSELMELGYRKNSWSQTVALMTDPSGQEGALPDGLLLDHHPVPAVGNPSVRPRNSGC